MKPTSARGATALTIAGFDPSSGAGITADLLTLAAHGIFGTAAITATTVQTTQGVVSVEPQPPETLRQTLLHLEADLPPSAIKLGMLSTAAHAEVVAEYLAHTRSKRTVTVVLDPILRASSGAALLQHADAAATLHQLFPLVDAITPNTMEAAALTGLTCTTPGQMAACARHLRTQYPHLRVVVTGGHLAGCADLLCAPEGETWFSGTHIDSSSTHGTGCAFASALLAQRLRGHSWTDATRLAKHFVVQGIARAIPRGEGHGPLALLTQLERQP